MSYNSSTGVIYCEPGVDPRIGIDVRDVQRALGTSRGDVGQLCTHQNINVWAKYKPVRFDQLDTTKNVNSGKKWLNADSTWVTKSDADADSTKEIPQWWRYKYLDVNSDLTYRCGFYIPATVSISENIANDLGEWEYLRPRGNSVTPNEPYRLVDFNQYYNRAICPFKITLPTRAVMHNNLLRGLVKVWRQTPVSTSLRPLNITMDDLFAIGGPNMWFGVAVIDITQNNRLLGAKTQTLVSDAAISLEELYSSVNDGDELLLVAFASPNQKTTWGGENTLIAYSLDAPGIDFATKGTCKVMSTLQTQYYIAVTGINGQGDRTVLMPGAASVGGGYVAAPNRGRINPTYNYNIISVRCTCELIDIEQDTTTVVGETYYTPNNLPNSNITVRPTRVAHNEGPYAEVACSDEYHVGEPSDPTVQYYQITYTFIYQKE